MCDCMIVCSFVFVSLTRGRVRLKCGVLTRGVLHPRFEHFILQFRHGFTVFTLSIAEFPMFSYFYSYFGFRCFYLLFGSIFNCFYLFIFKWLFGLSFGERFTLNPRPNLF